MKTKVATAIVEACSRAGRTFDAEHAESDATRIANLLRDGPYGPYIADGDPQEWSEGRAVATIYMETKGGKGDCHVPLEYYEDGFDVSAKASELLAGHYIEFINAAVACVYPV